VKTPVREAENPAEFAPPRPRQTTYLVNRQTLVTLETQRMTASVQLAEAVGGGWDASRMPSDKQVFSKAQ
jgi:hypothetical protein